MLNSVYHPSLSIIIQKNLLNDLEHAILEYNQVNNYKLKLDVAVYFLSLFNSIPTYYRDDEQTDDVSLYSPKLEKYHSRYFLYFNFFQKHGFINKIFNYGSDIGRSNTYSLSNKYSKDKLVSYLIYDKCFLKKFDAKGREKCQILKNEVCEMNRPHLTKFFNGNLSIDSIEAHREIDELSCNKENSGKYSTCCIMINEFENQEWRYSMKPQSDNRFHSNLTRLPKVLRKHLRYNNEPMIALDLKTSQPFFLCVIVKAIIKKDKGLLGMIKATEILNDETIQELFDLELNKDELAKFLITVLNKDFYNEFIKEHEIDYSDLGLPYRLVSVFSSNKKRQTRIIYDESGKPIMIEEYKSERDLAKSVLMEVFYSKPNSTTKEAKVFRNKYNSIHKIIKCLYKNEVELWRLLQYIEAFVLLDHVAKIIHEKHPEMPLFSIHDSLITTKSWANKLEEEILSHIKSLTTLTPKVEIEYWEISTIKEAI